MGIKTILTCFRASYYVYISVDSYRNVGNVDVCFIEMALAYEIEKPFNSSKQQLFAKKFKEKKSKQ